MVTYPQRRSSAHLKFDHTKPLPFRRVLTGHSGSGKLATRRPTAARAILDMAVTPAVCFKFGRKAAQKYIAREQTDPLEAMRRSQLHKWRDARKQFQKHDEHQDFITDKSKTVYAAGRAAADTTRGSNLN